MEEKKGIGTLQMQGMKYLYLLSMLVLNSCSVSDRNRFYRKGAEWVLACDFLKHGSDVGCICNGV